MKNIYFPALILLISLSGCGAARMNFNVLTPAPITIPQDIQSIAIIDRSLPEDTDLNKIESILTLEGPKQERAARMQVMNGLKQSLSSEGRYQLTVTDEMLVGSATGSNLPEMLPWNITEELAAKYQSDVIVAIETFDSDFIMTGAKLPTKGSPGAGASGIATVKCGFRMYWPARNILMDEFMFVHDMGWDSEGPAILAAINTVKIRNNAINDASYEAGVTYGQRVTPTRYRISRDYFKKGGGSQYLASGARMMQLNDWDKAIADLKIATETGKRKSRGRAAHNLAVVYEILGDLERAKECTTVAWGRYKEKKSRHYGYILTNRINEQAHLREQLN